MERCEWTLIIIFLTTQLLNFPCSHHLQHLAVRRRATSRTWEWLLGYSVRSRIHTIYVLFHPAMSSTSTSTLNSGSNKDTTSSSSSSIVSSTSNNDGLSYALILSLAKRLVTKSSTSTVSNPSDNDQLLPTSADESNEHPKFLQYLDCAMLEQVSVEELDQVIQLVKLLKKELATTKGDMLESPKLGKCLKRPPVEFPLTVSEDGRHGKKSDVKQVRPTSFFL